MKSLIMPCCQVHYISAMVANSKCLPCSSTYVSPYHSCHRAGEETPVHHHDTPDKTAIRKHSNIVYMYVQCSQVEMKVSLVMDKFVHSRDVRGGSCCIASQAML